MPVRVKHWTLTALRNQLLKIGCKVVHHAKRVVFQLAEVAIPRSLFALILRRIEGLRLRLRTPAPPAPPVPRCESVYRLESTCLSAIDALRIGENRHQIAQTPKHELGTRTIYRK